jgi:hypothetical protein
VENLIDLEEKWFNDIVSNKLEIWLPEVMGNVIFAAGEEIVDADHLTSKFACSACLQAIKLHEMAYVVSVLH